MAVSALILSVIALILYGFALTRITDLQDDCDEHNQKIDCLVGKIKEMEKNK